MAFPAGWERRIKITIPDAKISGNNTNFPILLTKDNLPPEMTNAGIFSALNGGGDVRFSEDAAGTTRLDLDIVTFVTNATPANVNIELHVKRPTLNTGAARDIYGWYKKAGEVQPAVGAAFGRNAVWSDYVAVWHLNDLTDSTGNGFTLSEVGTPTVSSDSPFDGGSSYELDGSTEYLEHTSWAKILHPFTMTLWMKSRDTGTTVMMSQGDISTTTWESLLWRASSLPEINNSGARDAEDPTSRNTNQWYNIAGVFADSDYELYTDGVSVDTQSFGVQDDGVRPELLIGALARNGSRLHFNGFISTVKIRNARLSTGRIATEHANQNDPATFAIAGTPEDVGGGDITGTGALTLGSITFSAAGLREITATGSLTLPNLQLSAAGQRVIPGTGSITLPVISLGGVGVRGISSTGSLILPSLELTGLGIKTSIGLGSVTLPAIILSGTDAAQVARVENTLNDLWAGYLKDRGHSGALNDRLVKAFQFETSTSGKDINTLMQLYFSQQGFVSGALNDRLLDFLKANYSSFDGATQDRLVAALKTNNFFI